jgi:putative endonuclease
MANFGTSDCMLQVKDPAHNLKVAGSNPAPATTLRGASMARVYVIQNAEGSFYIGMTTDLEQRLIDHDKGVSKWTKHRGPWSIVWSQQCPTIGEARKLENKLKRQGRGSGFYRMIDLTPPSGS